MANVLLTYGTTEGQTAKVSQHIADVGRRLGHRVDVAHAAEIDAGHSLDAFGAAIVGASVHEGHHQRYLVQWAKAHADWLKAHPSAFFSVCLSAASQDPDEVGEAESIIDHFAQQTGWTPARRTLVAGALRYSQYNWLKRTLMKHIAKKEGGGTDTRKDYEYTDWDAVTAWAESFFAELDG